MLGSGQPIRSPVELAVPARAKRAADRTVDATQQANVIAREVAAEVERGNRYREVMRQIESQDLVTRAMGRAGLMALQESQRLTQDERRLFRRQAEARVLAEGLYARDLQGSSPRPSQEAT